MFFLTGFPGFLGTEIIIRILKKDSTARFYCLVQEKFLTLAQQKCEEISIQIPDAKSRIHFVSGDITLPGLGITSGTLPQDSITEVFHFAAVYDLNVTEAVGKKINVLGTENILAFCESLPHFKKLHYVSTCYVSGKHKGTFLESDLDLGQKFNNFYESTKFEAEIRVREKMSKGLPASIYRPSIVVGNSQTGETQKFDGPYFIIQWLLRQGKFAILPKLGNPDRYTINLVPSDYVLDAMAYLCDQDSSISKTFHLADPNPLTISQVTQNLAEHCQKRIIEIPAPKSLTKWAVGAIPGLESWLGIPRSSLDYFVHPTRYDTKETQNALKTTSIHCPKFETYSQKLVEFMKKSPATRNQAMI